MKHTAEIKKIRHKIQSIDLSHQMAHYLFAIHKLKESNGYARATDIARELKLTKGTVSTMLTNLKKRQLIVEDGDSKFVDLSIEGHREVHRILAARRLFFHFFKDILKVSEEISLYDACQIEHLLSLESCHQLFLMMKNVYHHPIVKDIQTIEEFENLQNTNTGELEI